ncbi:hypothetical protein D1007_46854 [Hordeum vulgare]|nr:hypothetical protein D1007_46854 [Hordeum vulgare]
MPPLSYTPGVFPLPNETDSANFYKIALKRLSEAGYQHYEISSYCKPGYECKHNVTYWQNRPFYAFGLGPASCINGVGFSRPRGMKNYADWVQKLEDGTWCHESNVSETKDMALERTRSLCVFSERKHGRFQLQRTYSFATGYKK